AYEVHQRSPSRYAYAQRLKAGRSACFSPAGERSLRLAPRRRRLNHRRTALLAPRGAIQEIVTRGRGCGTRTDRRLLRRDARVLPARLGGRYVLSLDRESAALARTARRDRVALLVHVVILIVRIAEPPCLVGLELPLRELEIGVELLDRSVAHRNAHEIGKGTRRRRAALQPRHRPGVVSAHPHASGDTAREAHEPAVFV